MITRHYYNAESLDCALREYESEYGMATADFYERYTSGERLDLPDFAQHTWACFYEDILRMTGGSGIDRRPVTTRAHEAFACR
jgi:hypothetical protein